MSPQFANGSRKRWMRWFLSTANRLLPPAERCGKSWWSEAMTASRRTMHFNTSEKGDQIMLNRFQKAATGLLLVAGSSAPAWGLGGGRLAATQAMNGLAAEATGP